MPERYLMVTIDTEVDKSRSWLVSDPPTFRSVREGIPTRLSPLFDEFGVVPTYLLSPEVLEDPGSVEVLSDLGERAELGTHLHAEFVDPDRSLFPETMAGSPAAAIQCQYPPDTERAKLKNLTRLFGREFGYEPRSFRAGRYGLGPETHTFLSELGYRVDSSVTPGLRWRYSEGVLDYRNWSAAPRWLQTPAGRLLEMPVSIRPGSRLAPFVDRAPPAVARASRKVLGSRARQAWLRPSWSSGPELIRYVEDCDQALLVLMFHSMEVIPGASPYAESEEAVRKITDALHALFAHCVSVGVQFCGLSEAARHAP